MRVRGEGVWETCAMGRGGARSAWQSRRWRRARGLCTSMLQRAELRESEEEDLLKQALQQLDAIRPSYAREHCVCVLVGCYSRWKVQVGDG